MFEIHISDVRSFKQCRRKWAFSSPMQRNLEPLIPYAPFFTGRAVHFAMEMFRRHGTSQEEALETFLKKERTNMEKIGKLWPREESKLNEQIDLIRGMLQHYSKWVTKLDGPFAEDNLQFIALETEFSVPLYSPKSGRKSSRVFFAGRFDGLVMRKDDGSFWIWETKTTRSIDELYKSLANDEQCGAYVYAAQQLFGLPVTGVMYDLLRKKVPTQPQVLQSGRLSVNKQIDTTADVYMDAIREVHPEWFENERPTEQGRVELMNAYGDILTMLMDAGNKFFARVPVYRTHREIDQLATDLHATALEMARPTTPLYPNPNWLNCNFCLFRAPCLLMNAQGDYEFVLQEEFRPRVDAKDWQYYMDKNGES